MLATSCKCLLLFFSLFSLQKAVGAIPLAKEEDRSSTRLPELPQHPENRSVAYGCHKDQRKPFCKYYRGRKVKGEKKKKEFAMKGIDITEGCKNRAVSVGSHFFVQTLQCESIFLNFIHNSEHSRYQIMLSPLLHIYFLVIQVEIENKVPNLY